MVGGSGGMKWTVEGLGAAIVFLVSIVVAVVLAAVLVVSELHNPTAGLSARWPPERRFPSLQTESRNLTSASSASITGKKSSVILSNVLQ